MGTPKSMGDAQKYVWKQLCGDTKCISTNLQTALDPAQYQNQAVISFYLNNAARRSDSDNTTRMINNGKALACASDTMKRALWDFAHLQNEKIALHQWKKDRSTFKKVTSAVTISKACKGEEKRESLKRRQEEAESIFPLKGQGPLLLVGLAVLLVGLQGQLGSASIIAARSPSSSASES